MENFDSGEFRGVVIDFNIVGSVETLRNILPGAVIEVADDAMYDGEFLYAGDKLISKVRGNGNVPQIKDFLRYSKHSSPEDRVTLTNACDIIGEDIDSLKSTKVYFDRATGGAYVDTTDEVVVNLDDCEEMYMFNMDYVQTGLIPDFRLYLENNMFIEKWQISDFQHRTSIALSYIEEIKNIFLIPSVLENVALKKLTEFDPGVGYE